MHGAFLTADRFDYPSERAALHVAARAVTECRALRRRAVLENGMFKDRRDAARRLARAAPLDFYGVSLFYGDFRPMTGDDVVRLLEAPPVSAPK
jgi:hypothetical protein